MWLDKLGKTFWHTQVIDATFGKFPNFLTVLTKWFIVFSGFGLLESGSVTTKNEVNIMVKNAVDVIVGGLSYWMFGYALRYEKIKKKYSFTWH